MKSPTLNRKFARGNEPQQARWRRGGYTLLEIMMVVGIIIVLLGGAIYYTTGFSAIGQRAAAEADIKMIQTSLKAFEMLQRRPPTNEQGLEALVERPADLPYPNKWIQQFEKMPIDPWGNPYQYRYPAERSSRPYDVWSMGEDRQSGTEDDVGNWE
jgi:general secretion pathway protein G